MQRTKVFALANFECKSVAEIIFCKPFAEPTTTLPHRAALYKGRKKGGGGDRAAFHNGREREEKTALYYRTVGKWERNSTAFHDCLERGKKAGLHFRTVGKIIIIKKKT